MDALASQKSASLKTLSDFFNNKTIKKVHAVMKKSEKETRKSKEPKSVVKDAIENVQEE